MLALRPNLPIILYTGYSRDISSNNKSFTPGVGKFLVKPLVVRSRAALIRKLLENKSTLAKVDEML
jgi:DNA-binding NtrC family response regulator